MPRESSSCQANMCSVLCRDRFVVLLLFCKYVKFILMFWFPMLVIIMWPLSDLLRQILFVFCGCVITGSMNNRNISVDQLSIGWIDWHQILVFIQIGGLWGISQVSVEILYTDVELLYLSKQTGFLVDRWKHVSPNSFLLIFIPWVSVDNLPPYGIMHGAQTWPSLYWQEA